MANATHQKWHRLLSAVLVVVMLLSLLPTTIAAEQEDPEQKAAEYVVLVKDQDTDKGIPEAVIEYTVLVDGEAVEEAASVKTDEDGKAVIAEVADCAEALAEEKAVALEYSVSAEHYAAKEKQTQSISAVDEQLEVKLVFNMASVIVKQTGEGTVTVNDKTDEAYIVTKGDKLSIKVTPKQDDVIKSVKIGDELQTLENPAQETAFEVEVQGDLEIQVEFLNKYQISYTETGSSSAGTITVNGTVLGEESYKVEGDTEVSIQVEAPADYVISSLVIGDAQQTISETDPTKFELASYTVRKDTTIAVTYAPMYQIVVNYDADKGAVSTDPECEAGTVKIVQGKELKITATPNATYRVIQIEAKDETSGKTSNLNSDDLGKNETAVNVSLSNVQSDMTVTISFAPNRYQVETSVNNGNCGRIVCNQNTVDHGASVAFSIVVYNGYKVSTMTVLENGKPVADDRIAKNGNNVEVKNAAGDISVRVDFISSAARPFSGNVSMTTTDAVKYDQSNAVVVLKNTADAKVTLVPIGGSNNRLYVYYQDGERTINTRRVDIAQSRVFSSLYVFIPGFWADESYPIDFNSTLKAVVKDDKAPEVEFKPEDQGAAQYSKDFEVSVNATDPLFQNLAGSFSGVKEITAWVTSNGEQTQEPVVLFSLGEDDSASAQQTVEAKLTVDASKNDSDNVVVHVTVTDVAGNSAEYASQVFEVNTEAPSMAVTVGGTKSGEALDNQPYYNQPRQVSFTITDRASSLNENGLVIRDNGEEVRARWDGSSFVYTFEGEGEHNWTAVYTNRAGSTCEIDPEQVTGRDPFVFTLDLTAPEAAIQAEGGSVITKMLEKITFGLFRSQPTAVSVTEKKDGLTGVQKVLFYKDVTHSSEPLGSEALDQLYQQGKFLPQENDRVEGLDKDEIFVVYARITDNAGNSLYLGSNGVVVDSTASVIEASPQAGSINGYFTSETVTVFVNVNDDVLKDTDFSGLKTVDYQILLDGKVKDRGNLFTADPNKEPQVSDLKAELKDAQIVVNSAKYNSDNVEVRITAEDNAGNKAADVSVPLKINVTNPTAVLSYDVNEKANLPHAEEPYFNVARTATLTITDRAGTFDWENVKVTIDSAVNGAGDALNITSDDIIKSKADDGDTHVMTLVFDKDANYQWSVEYTNLAGLEMEEVALAKGTKHPYQFTVDRTAPTGGITVTAKDQDGEQTILEWLWNGFLKVITFGKYNNNSTVTVNAFGEDVTSPVVPVEYYQYQLKDELSELPAAELADQLDDLYAKHEFHPFNPIEISPEAEFLAYLRVTDKAGNYTYINTNGVVVDSKASEIKAEPSEKDNDAYGLKENEDGIKVAYTVTDEWPYSGIKSVDYVVLDNGVETQSGNRYLDEDNVNRAHEFPDEITVIVTDTMNNSSNVEVVITTVDHAGNVNTVTIPLDIDITAPSVSVKFVDQANGNAEPSYYTARQAIVTITERSNHFDKDEATAGISIHAADVNGNPIEEVSWEISDWTDYPDQGKPEVPADETHEGSAAVPANPDKDQHVATITFYGDANYVLDISYTDEAGNSNQPVTYTDKSDNEFTVDNTVPNATLVATVAEDPANPRSWSDPVLDEDVAFGIWSAKSIAVQQTSSDDISPIKSVEYFKLQAAEAKNLTAGYTMEQIENISSWTPYPEDGLSLAEDQQCVIYLKVTDNAGNVRYLSTDGLIVDHNHPQEVVAPVITVTPAEQPINGIYNADFDVKIDVKDPEVGGTYSGLKEVRYEVYNRSSAAPNTPTQSGTLFKFDKATPKQGELEQTFSTSIKVDAEKNNSNDVQIVVYAVDNAGNAINNRSDNAVHVKVDTTAPKINVSYNNNSADSGTYFKASRTATIRITERNFDPDDVVLTLTSSAGSAPQLVGWTETAGRQPNADDTVHTATILFAADADYTFDIAYTDEAGNKAPKAEFAENTVAANAFTVDNIDPKVSVSYDNTSAQNGNYYKAARTATIVITEHNFDSSRVAISLAATDDGANAPIPGVSTWRSNGDTHTATISYTGDARYTFDIKVTDKAGRVFDGYNEDVFFVDKTAPKLEITGVENNSANRDDIIPVVTYSDTNWDPNLAKITLDGANRGDVKLDGGYQDIHNGRRFVFNNFPVEKEVDDIYTLTATLTDKAGNTTTQTIRFSANRFGSAYEMSKETKALNGTYVREAGNVVMTEVNPDELQNIKLTIFKNNKSTVLKEGRDYTVEQSGGNGEWFKYVYTVFSKNYEDGGVYRITFHSEDKAGNVAENTLETKGAELGFGIDQVDPTVSVLNLESGKTYNLEKMQVNMTANDDLKLDSVVIYLDGKEYITLSEDELDELVRNGGNYSFDINGDSTDAHELRIVATDAAGNQYVEGIDNFYVTTNLWVRYHNNKPLFYGSILGALVIAASWIFFIVAKRRKEDEEEEQTTAAG